MTGNDLVLRFRYPDESQSQHANDMRTVNIKQVAVSDEQETEADLYKFYHPVIQGLRTGVTTYHRMNTSTGTWMMAGSIDWQTDSTCNVFFGGTEKVPPLSNYYVRQRTKNVQVHIRELRKSKKATSKSRRFKAGGSEYKWKLAENGRDLTCLSQQLTSYGKTVAEWSQETLTLRVAERVEPILDRVVVTLFLNLWMRSMDDW
ncbi:hypothetical protein PHLGIDRAFT_123891 [Phlebiopsis gigantea 11061_1 CR5-6]|uniref:DUF6593 domain-containing protein n=1 Tax=Phlebiopsis gigantea (strain 11061_1 CR5-6) TaxID=745531 RepID=A0A0C3S866_PHLG1|nr:hypothetical protein PHLGIDRAFT_123891 [Phlebiopsis gigantea 11061_1 CR5-6]